MTLKEIKDQEQFEEYRAIQNKISDIIVKISKLLYTDTYLTTPEKRIILDLLNSYYYSIRAYIQQYKRERGI